MKNTQSTSISTKFQTVVPAYVRRILGLKAGDRLYWRINYKGNTPMVIAEPKPDSWSKASRGVGKDLWKSIDVKTYINSLRDQWEAQKYIL